MVNYTCNRCGKEFKQKCHLLNHLSRKKPCKSILKEIDNIEILRLNKIEEYNKDHYKVSQKSVESKSYKCRYCDNSYIHKQSRWKHEQKCKEKMLKEKDKIINKKDEQIMELLKLLGKKGVNKQIIKGNNNTINNNIQINNFDRENIDYISKRVAMKVAKNFNVMVGKFVELIHFNEKHPENHTIRIKDMKSGLAEIREDNKWQFIDINDFLDEMRISLYDKLQSLRDNIDETEINIYDNYMEKVDELLDNIKKIKVINKSSQYKWIK